MKSDKPQKIIPPDYSPSDLVRIELLRYEQTEGLHIVERAWRDLAKKLLLHIEMLDSQLEKETIDSYNYAKHTPFQFPKGM